MKKIMLIRHGQASWGKRNYDILSEVGVQQSNVLGKLLQAWNLNTTAIITGTHTRQIDTAKHCQTAMHLEPSWLADEHWNEFNFQDVIERYKPLYKVHSLMVADLVRTGAPRENFKRMFEASIQEWLSGKRDHVYQEDWGSFQQRIHQAKESLKTIDSEQIVVFTSGGVIGLIVCLILNLDLSHWRSITEQIINTSITQIGLNKEKFSLISFNEHGHLLGKHKDLFTTH